MRTPRPTDPLAASHLSGSPAQGLPRRPRPRLRRRSCWPRCCCWCTSCARCTRCCSRRRAPWWLPIGCPSLRSSRSAATPPPSPRCPPRSLQGGASGAWRQMPGRVNQNQRTTTSCVFFRRFTCVSLKIDFFQTRCKCQGIEQIKQRQSFYSPVPSTQWCRSTQNIAGGIKGCLFVCEASHSSMKLSLSGCGTTVGNLLVYILSHRLKRGPSKGDEKPGCCRHGQWAGFSICTNAAIGLWDGGTYLLCIIFIHWYHCLYWPVTCNKVKGETLNEHLQFSMSRATINTVHTGSFNFGLYLRLFPMPPPE